VGVCIRSAKGVSLRLPQDAKTLDAMLPEDIFEGVGVSDDAADGRLGTEGREERVAEFEGRLSALCRPYWRDPTPDMPPHERDFANLVNELTQRLFDEQLFTFVLNPEVDPTNNLAERLQRSPAKDRDAGRTSKTAAGARRRSVITSVLESLRVNLSSFTLRNVVDEVTRWMKEGISLFNSSPYT